MKKNLLKFTLLIFLAFVIFSPLLVSAQTIPVPCLGPACPPQFTPSSNATGLTAVVAKISELFSAILPILISIGVLFFVWGVVQYFIADSEEAKKTGKDRIIYGIIGLAVIVSLWGLVYLITDTFGIRGANAPNTTNLVVQAPASSGCDSKSPSRSSKISNVIDYFTCVIGQSIIPFLFALAVVMFIWGAIKFFIIDAEEEAKKAQGRQFMLWGIIALAVMLSIWGLVGILQNTFGLSTGGSVLPSVQPSR